MEDPIRPQQYLSPMRLVIRDDGDDEDGFNINIVGRRRNWLGDAYVRLLSSSWQRLVLIVVLIYLGINLAFAGLYLAIGNDIAHARPGSFADAFFFSVQTMATIGYGTMSPLGAAANGLVTVEALFGFGYIALVTGLMFSKFSRPTARVIFSNVAVISDYDGVPHLMMRLANERFNRIVDAHVHAVVLRNVRSREGMLMRRFHDLKLVRSRVPFMQLTWTLLHRIDEHSPLYGKTRQDLIDDESEIILALYGLDETLMQTIHARFSYVAREVIFDAAFEDILHRSPDGTAEIHFDKFNDIRMLNAAQNPGKA